MLVNEKGCIIHRNIHWDRCEEGHSIFKCNDCNEDAAREPEDSGCGG